MLVMCRIIVSITTNGGGSSGRSSSRSRRVTMGTENGSLVTLFGMIFIDVMHTGSVTCAMRVACSLQSFH